MFALRGRRALEDAFRELVAFVDTLMTSGADLSTVQHAPVFSYILTNKQIAKVKKVCQDEGWPMPRWRGIEITVSTVAHILDSRLSERGVTAAFVAEIMAAAYCENSEVYVNKRHGLKSNQGHDEQAVFLNAVTKLPLNGTKWSAVAIVALNHQDAEGQKKMASITAYYADEAKIRSIKR
ncbi:hypothetical protein [Paraburkholderia strydomiana]|uniref:Uncharacterized protein n=1 Tax=Paraburkholderia strydomiana TaxID=1245417 RepID=A0ABW9CC37_9BURK